MIPELKRAIMKYVPEYFSWNIEKQEEYRVNIPKEISFKIRSFFIAKLFGITVINEDEMAKAEDHFSEAQWSTINGAMLPLQGVGEDYFFLNESFSKGKSILSYATLYDYDFADYQFQEKCRIRDCKGYMGKPYYGTLHWNWARLQIDGKFSYALLSMVASYIQSEIDEFGNDYIQELIPYEFKPGKDHGRRSGEGYFCYDMEADAGGLESQLDELNRRLWSHLQEILDRLQLEFAEKNRQQIFILNTSRDDAPEHHFIFTDSAILPYINLKTFLIDCRKAEQKDHSILTQKVQQEKELIRHYLDEQYTNIMANFNTKIVQLRKKKKIRFHKDSGLADLLD